MNLDSIFTPARLNAEFPLPRGQRWDSFSTALFLRQLTDVVTQTYDVQYTELKARKLIPVDNRFNTGAEAFVWRMFDITGDARFIDGMADDLPNADAIGAEFPGVFKSMGVSYQYTVQDMRAAAMAGIPLDQKKAEAARKKLEMLLEDAASGNTNIAGALAAKNAGLKGLCTNSDITIMPTANQWVTYTSGVPTMTATVSQVLADINAAQNTIVYATKGTETPDTLVLPTGVYSALGTAQRSVTFTDDTVLQYILKSSPWLKSIEFWPRLDTATTLTGGAGAGGAGAHGRCWMYKKDPRCLALNISQEFEQFPPQLRDLSFKIPCHMRIGGVTYRYPKSAIFLDGADG